jgi:hypothetical protein
MSTTSNFKQMRKIRRTRETIQEPFTDGGVAHNAYCKNRSSAAAAASASATVAEDAGAQVILTKADNGSEKCEILHV